MTVITDTWRQLVRRRLWPVALLLVAALVAVPLALAKSPAPAPPAHAAAASTAADPMTSYVSLAQPDATETKRRRVLGASKDPFEPAPLPKVKKRRTVSRAADVTPTATPSTETPNSNAGGGGVSAPPSAGPTPAPAPTVTIAKGSIRVRFGTVGDATTADPAESIIGHLEPLPSADAPVLVLDSIKSNGKTAVFSIPGDVSAIGDGKCSPSPDACTELELKAGETEFITVKGGGENGADVQYQLDLVKIYAKSTAVPKDSVPAAGGGSTP